MGRKHYWEAAIWFAVSWIPTTVGCLEWHYHRRVSIAVVLWALFCWLFVVLSVRRGRRAT